SLPATRPSPPSPTATPRWRCFRPSSPGSRRSGRSLVDRSYRHRLGVALHQVADLRDGLAERGFVLGAQRLVARQLHAEWIDEAAIDLDLEMQVRAGRVAGRADIADELA